MGFIKNWLIIGIIGTLILSFISGIMEGTGSNAKTVLTSALSRTATASMTVSSTAGFPSSGYVVIGNEKIYYTATDATHFNNLTRGYLSTTSASHPNGAAAYSPEMGIVNSIFGFNLLSAEGTTGSVDILQVSQHILTFTVPKILLWNFSMYERMPWLLLRLLFFVVCSLPIILEVAYFIATIVGGVAQSILRLI